MNRTAVSVLALSVAAFASTAALADEPALAKTRAQVLAELADAQRTGDVLDIASGLKLNELNPSRYATPAQGTAKTRAQVQAELAEAVRTGEIVVIEHAGLKANEVNPAAYPAKPAAQGKTREQVKAELAEAKRKGTMPVLGDA
jgi:hypothetical protein